MNVKCNHDQIPWELLSYIPPLGCWPPHVVKNCGEVIFCGIKPSLLINSAPILENIKLQLAAPLRGIIPEENISLNLIDYMSGLPFHHVLGTSF